MRILFVWSSASWSTFDVARGYRTALERQGHAIRDYRLYQRLIYHHKALGKVGEDMAVLSRQASEAVLIEAVHHQADLVLIVSGMGFHPNGLWLLRQIGIPTAVLLTESPYEDGPQAEFAKLADLVFTNDRYSARHYGWHYLAHAIDPAIHYPRDQEEQYLCDVLLLGTGWPERQQFLEQIDWTWIDLRLLGLWPGIKRGTALWAYYQETLIDNESTPPLYSNARICLNLHRASPVAESLNPRGREIAACGAFQLSDRRAELDDVFDGAVPTFSTPAELENLIRYYLAHEAERQIAAEQARQCVQNETFERRAADLMSVVRGRFSRPRLAAVG